MALLIEACLSKSHFLRLICFQTIIFHYGMKNPKRTYFLTLYLKHIFKGIFSSKFLSELHLSKDLKRWKKFCKKYRKNREQNIGWDFAHPVVMSKVQGRNGGNNWDIECNYTRIGNNELLSAGKFSNSNRGCKHMQYAQWTIKA